MLRLIALCLAAAVLSGLHNAAATVSPSLQLQVETRMGKFSVDFNGKHWLAGSEYRVGSMSSSEGHIVISSHATSVGTDKLGGFNSTQLNWTPAGGDRLLMQTNFREYDGFIVFEQYFPDGLDESTLSGVRPGQGLSAATLFPSFERKKASPGDHHQYHGSQDDVLSCFSHHGTFAILKPCTLSDYEETPSGGVPLVIYNGSDPSLPMTVFSPLNDPMAHHMANADNFFGAGVKATVDSIPPGWRQQFILSAGEGINAGMMAWGERMLTFTGRPRVDNRYLDDVHGSIGFWTDNGGYYHYSIGNNKSLGKNYEEVLPKVKAYHDELGIPFKHWQFDSWFYPKDGPVNKGGGGGAVTNWTALPDIFPSGMAKIQELLGVPMVMHNRQWSNISDYIHNWTDIEWYTSKLAAVPKDPLQFFNRFFTQQEGWGLSMYEQDWMVSEYQVVDQLHTNISLGDLWLYGMAQGAQNSNRTVQYCMPLPNEILSAAYLPAVTSARATHDYFHLTDQWAIGQNALFYWALNILPFKDGFYSSNLKQEGGQTVGPETDPDREALMATLSAAMVGPMDGIYLLNASRVMQTCRKDGKILKPDRPLTVTDACFRAGNPTCKVYETQTYLEGYGTVHYYFNNDGKAPMLADEVYLKEGDEYAVYNWYTGELKELQSTNVVEAGYEGHVYALVMPIASGWVFMGEVDKYVSTSGLRFGSLEVNSDELSVQLTGVKGEQVKVCVGKITAVTKQTSCKVAVFSSDDSWQTLSFKAPSSADVQYV